MTGIQLAFSLHSASVSLLCYILWHKHQYDCSHSALLKPNHYKRPHITPPTCRGKLNGKLECLVAPQTAHSYITIAGMFQWLCWLPIDGRERHWLRAPRIKRKEIIGVYHLAPPITPHSWITSSYPGWRVGYFNRLAVAWHRNRRVLCIDGKFWQGVCSNANFFEGPGFWISVCL